MVYDSVGKTTFEKGLNVLRPRGMMALFGSLSGAVAPFDPLVLTQKGSLFLTRPSLGSYVITGEELQNREGAVFGIIRNHKLESMSMCMHWRRRSRRIATWKGGKPLGRYY